MIISLNWLKKFVEIDSSVEELSILIGSRLVEIEHVENLREKYKDVLIVKVTEAGKLEGSDHLSLTKIDDGGVARNVERDEKGYIQVVCGAPNITAGQLVAWLPPESIVPETFGSTSEFKLGVRSLLGVTSNGMIASAKELGISDDHKGILVINESEGFAPGTLFMSAYELDDYLLHIENKSLTHRPDCFGIIGFAREVAAIIGKKFITSDWLMDSSIDFGSKTPEVELNVLIDNPDVSSRYLAVVMSEADSKRKSPLLIQTYLSRVGVRPINSVVDVTNYLMMMTGQPLHAFDYDKLIALNGGKADVKVRLAKAGEKLELLDGKSIELSTSDIVITSGDAVIGLAGAMGGANTEIDDNTSRIIIESATFNLYNLRSTQMRHGIFSEAITRFTKGQPAYLTAPVLAKAVEFAGDWSGARVISKVAESFPGNKEKTVIKINIDRINQVLGTDIDKNKIVEILNFAEFETVIYENEIEVTAPYWRSDIHIEEDIIEEIGRLYGFDNIKLDLPIRDFTATTVSEFDNFRSKIRKILVRTGSNEVLNYSFLHGDILKKANQNIDNSYKIVNSISPDLQYYRQTLSPSLLNIVNSNIRQGYDSFSIFEINKVHQKNLGLTDENVPLEFNNLAYVYANKTSENGASYYKSKKVLDYLCLLLGVELQYRPLSKDDDGAIFSVFEPQRSAVVYAGEDTIVGVVGEYKKSVIRGFKLAEYTSGFEIDLDALFNIKKTSVYKYQPISRYPATERDICFQVSRDVTYLQLINSLSESLGGLNFEASIVPVDIYQPENSEVKNITVRIKLISHDHTPESKEVNTVVDEIIAKMKNSIDFSVI